jgi:hypothetical protein
MSAVFVLVLWLAGSGAGADQPRAIYGPYASNPECMTAGNAKVASLAKSKWAGQVHFACLPAVPPDNSQSES